MRAFIFSRGMLARLGLLLLLAGFCGLALVSLGADPTPRTYYGLCDASAAVWLDGQTFAVGDDENNVIRVYSRHGKDTPLHSLDVSNFLKVDPKHPEADIEGAARVGDVVYWITSHGRNAKGKRRPSRERLFATRQMVQEGIPTLVTLGVPYCRLLEDFAADSRLQRFNLAAAAILAPKARGGLNIEGLAVTPEGHLLIGFRNPIPQGQALLIPLLNPSEVIQGGSARFGDAQLLPLDGLGIRGITEWRGGYVIAAGSYNGNPKSGFYLWAGPGHLPERLPLAGLGGLNPEALASDPEPGHHDLLLVSDDGNLLVGSEPCKTLKQPMQKRFRAVILPENDIPSSLGRPRSSP
jgi:hypothetical protein